MKNKNTLMQTSSKMITALLFIIFFSTAAPAMVGGLDTGIAYFGNQSAFFTLGNEIKTQGPVYDTADSETAYINKVFRIIVQKGDKIGRDYRDEGNLHAYFAFLLGSLVVPYHEGHLIHLVQHDPIKDLCHTNLNNGEFIRNKRTKDKPLNPYQAFTKYFKDVTPRVTPNCNQFDPTQPAVQYLASLDRLSAGMMQIVLHWHIEDYVSLNKHLSVADTIEYGLNYYYSGFNKVLRNAVPGRKYSCVFLKGTNNIDYFDLVRGSWAGKYNNGNEYYTCRLYNNPPASKEAKKRDKAFKEDLERFTKTKENMFTQNLQDLERRAYDEIIDGFLNPTAPDGSPASTKNIDLLLAK